MKKILKLLIILLLLPAKSILTIEPIPLEELSRPSMFLVKHERIYVLEMATVYIYSLKDFKLLKKFGKTGEGPEEFQYERGGRPLSMSFYNNQLLVNSELKVSYFDPQGNYLREKKVPVDRLLFPINGRLLGIGPTPGEDKKRYMGFTLFNKNFKSKKIIFLSDFEMGNTRKLLLPVTGFTYNPVYKGKIYVNANSEDFKINVYNTEGKKEYVIDKQYPKLKISENFRQEALDFFKTSLQFKRAYEFLKKILQIRENYPPIRDLQMQDDSIYVITFKRKGDLWECVKLDLKGKEQGRTFIPLNRYEHLTLYPILYSVYKGKIYTLVEDEKDEIWKIHISEI